MRTWKLIFVLTMSAPLLLSGACSSDSHGPTAATLTPADEAAPLPPVGLEAPEVKVTRSGFLLLWSANQEADVFGYRVYLYEPSPDRMEAYLPVDSRQTLTEPRAAIQRDMSTPTWVRVTAVDASGNESPMSEALYVGLGGGPSGDANSGTSERDPRTPSAGPGGDGHSDGTPR